MAVDVTQPSVTRSSATMTLTSRDKQFMVFHQEGFQLLVPSWCGEMIEKTFPFFIIIIFIIFPNSVQQSLMRYIGRHSQNRSQNHGYWSGVFDARISATITVTYGILHEYLIIGAQVNSPNAGDRIFWLWCSIPCLQMPWLLESPEHHQA